ncbi:TIGR00269 family protein [Nocardiopsis rhodophaea]|uniref:TIGR00269 family protein n=1 Tax=Nocardiopsis rhodophaea TaxID=280238 RepID=A0ABP5F1N6_9ACTN
MSATKCHRCGDRAAIELRQHRMVYCAECFLRHCREQVRRTIDRHAMLSSDDHPLVAVSGGKDSLAVWDILLDLGYRADGLYLGLGIGQYSERSAEHAREFAKRRGPRLIEVDLADEAGFAIPQAARGARPACSACGLSKRHMINRAALEHGYEVVVTGHNLDDEAAVLFGNVLRWEVDYLARQRPVLPESEGFARRVKPLVRLSERETAAYCAIRGINYIIEECPMAGGNRHLAYKEMLNQLEERQPGAKLSFVSGFVNRVQPMLSHAADAGNADEAEVHPCSRCGSPTTSEVCAFCRLTDRVRDAAPTGRRGRRRTRRAAQRSQH